MRFFYKIKSMNIYIYKITEWIGITLLSLIFIILILQVICRYVVGSSLPWPEEASIFLFIWVCLIGANLGLKNREHLGLIMFVNLLPTAIKNWVTFITDCLIGFFAGYLFIYGWKIALLVGGGQRTSILNIPYTYTYLSITVGGFLLIIQALFLINDDIKNILSYKTNK
jgi:C4-dicarboxylate transporter DctQ subunit